MTRLRVVPDDAQGRAIAIDALRAGRLVAMPTDTVYGIGVTLTALDGLERLFVAKHRPPEKGVVLLLADHHQADSIALMSPAAHVLAAAFWPGGLTIVAPARPDVGLPAALTGGRGSVGLRVPAHDSPRVLATALGPLPVTSANRSGEPDAIDAAGVLDQLAEATDLEVVLDGGPARVGVPSTVVDCTSAMPRLLRAGAIPIEALVSVLDEAGLDHRLVP